MQKTHRISTAKDSLLCMDRGWYEANGKKIDLNSFTSFTNKNTELLTPEYLESLTLPESGEFNTEFSVLNETSISACERLAASDSGWMCLNFASAKNAGGGFLGGAEAQEESIARLSALYPSLISQPTYYEYHRGLGTCLYSDHMIYSPKVCIFKNEEGEYLENPYVVSFITSPAVNAGAIKNNEPENLALLEPTMVVRTRKMLKLAAFHQHKNLILGAWGCGVFANDPEMIAGIFHKLLSTEFKGVFEKVHFAVLSKDGRVLAPFETRFKMI